MNRLPSLGSLRSIANAYDEEDISDEEEVPKSKKRKLSTEEKSEIKEEDSDLDIVVSDEEENSSGAGSVKNVVVQPAVTKASRLVSYAGDEDEENDASNVRESAEPFDIEASTSTEALPDTLPLAGSEGPTQSFEGAVQSSLEESSTTSENQSKSQEKTEESSNSLEKEDNKDAMPKEIQDHLAVVKAIQVTLPEQSDGRCSNSLQEKIENLLKKKQRTGLDLKRSIQQKKNLRNPSIYEKLVSFCSIKEIGTNYPKEIYDPFSWTEDSFYERLSKIQKDQHEKKQKERSKVEFRSATKTTATSTAGEPRIRRSKWDVTSSGTATLTIPASAVQTIASVQAVVANLQAKKA